jgi:sugar phosphate isomerase/epimerase
MAPSGADEPAPVLPLTLGVMVWRIGQILEFDQQVAWIAAAGFESVGFHASRGAGGQWRGIDPAETDADQRRQIRRLLAPFRQCEIHAPFDAQPSANTPEDVLLRLESVLQLAADVGVSVVTVHADQPPPLDGDKPVGNWHQALDRLDKAAARVKVRIGIEFNTGFEWLRKPRRDWIGATLDVGHMVFDHAPGYRPWGTIGGQIRYLDDVLFHMHLHDNTGTVDHIEIGTGKVDWDDTLRALAEIGYQGSMVLEPNPDRVTPEGIGRSADFVRRRARQLGLSAGS